MNLLEKAERIIDKQIQILGFNGEVICIIDSNTEISVMGRYNNGSFDSYSVYAELEPEQEPALLGRYKTLAEAENLVSIIQSELIAGVTFYRLSANDEGETAMTDFNKLPREELIKRLREVEWVLAGCVKQAEEFGRKRAGKDLFFNYASQADYLKASIQTLREIIAFPV